MMQQQQQEQQQQQCLPARLPHVVIIGAGPIGVEMALNLVLANKYTVTLIEKGPHVAFHIQDYWAQVQLFSPNSLNMSATGRKILQERGVPIPDENAYFSGGKFAQEYLVPLLKFLQESDKCSVVFNTNVESVGRKDAPKHRSFPGRSKRKFHLLCSSGEYESFYEADSVIDASGSYSNPNYMGPGGLPAVGERRLRSLGRISHYIPTTVAGPLSTVPITTAVIGSGASAITTIKMILERNENLSTTGGAHSNILWITRVPSDEAPYQVIAGDSLPMRETLYSLANSLASAGSAHARANVGGDTFLQYKCNSNITKIEEVSQEGHDSSSLRLTLQPCGEENSQSNLETFDVHEVIANCGYHPDTFMTRELQVHYCYASEGPMKLAAAMLASSGGGSGDCLAQVLPGKETLRSPEARFFVIGMKSYGRGSSFLLRIGYEQVEHVMALLAEENF